MEIKINDEKLEFFSSEAKDSLEEEVTKYINDVIKEAGRIEAGTRGKRNTPEITAPYIREASKSNFRLRQGRPKKSIVAQIISSVSILFAGLLYDKAAFTNNEWQLPTFVLILVLVGIFTTLTFVWEDK
ncbi:MAG: hypothetical protein JJE17_00090 [Peptostreptococcaceae bacterium]|nr:hypothetical protein [Peptostreptococcaceae bacterium]